MNKTININLASTFFHMDESAYVILKSYLNKLESAFKNTNGKDEILRDIEIRIAELFQERKINQDYVISEIDVNQIITILGQPQDFILDEEENSETQGTKSEKKLFRDPENKYIGGVASGLGYYFGIDVSLIRLLWILFALFSIGTLFPIYVILWIIIPEAKTTADLLKMKGEPVNIDTIQKKIKKEFDEVSSKIKDVDYQKTTKTLKKKSKNFFAFLEGILKQVPKIISKLVGVILVLVSSAGIIGVLIGSFIFIVFGSLHWPVEFHSSFFNFSIFQSLYFTIALFLISIIPFLFMFSLGMRLLNSKSSTFGLISRYILFGIWIIAFLFIAIMSSEEIKNHNMTATKTNVEALSIEKKDTLFIQTRLDRIENSDQRWEFNRTNKFNRSFGNFWRKKNDVKIKLKKSDESYSFIELKYTANGASKEKAQKNAAQIFYNWNFNENILHLEPFWDKASSSPYFNQKLNINLYIEKGQIIFINKKIRPLLSYSLHNDQDYTKREITGHYWKMGPDKLECLDCSVKKDTLNVELQDNSNP